MATRKNRKYDDDDEKKTLYHYTDEAGAVGIARTGKIRKSEWSASRDDARFGNGAYLTSVRPQEGKYAVAKNNWDGTQSHVAKVVDSGKVDYVYKVTVPKNDVEKIKDAHGRSIYLHRGDLNITKDMNPALGVVPNHPR